LANRDILAVGTSAGGVEALVFLAKNFPSDLPASVLLTLHLPWHAHSELDAILTNAGPLPASFAVDGETLKKGHVYIAPPNRHLLLGNNRLSLGNGPRENNSRPSIDAMLRSAAVCCSARTVGVVLTGTLGDGASGLWAVRTAGGIAVVQDPRDAAFSEMPQTALNRAKPQHVASLVEMPALLDRLVRQPAGKPRPLPANIKSEVEIARNGASTMYEMDAFGKRSMLACPDCGGVMWEIEEEELSRFRCHVGHTYTAEVMSVALDDSLRRALAIAQRALEERLLLARKLYQQATESGHPYLAQTWAQRCHEFEREMETIRSSIRRIDQAVTKADLKRPTLVAG
jgi:two-component system chemotaxis response regulator CheB